MPNYAIDSQFYIYFYFFSESLTRKPIVASGLVSSMIESTKELWDMEMPAKFVSFMFSLSRLFEIPQEHGPRQSPQGTTSYVTKGHNGPRPNDVIIKVKKNNISKKT